MRCGFGGLAQLGERLPCKQEVVGSIPINSTSSAVLAMLAFVRFSSLLLLLSQLKASRVYTMFCGRMAFYRSVAQLVEYSTDNRAVGGSIPSTSTTIWDCSGFDGVLRG